MFSTSYERKYIWITSKMSNEKERLCFSYFQKYTSILFKEIFTSGFKMHLFQSIIDAFIQIKINA